jgi:hypothetical protein
MSRAPAIEIHEVLNQAPLDYLHGGHIDVPRPNTEYDSYDFRLVGWALGRSSSVDRIEVVLREGRSVLHLPLNQGRPDVADSFREAADGEPTGFEATIGVLDLPQQFDIPVHAVLGTGKRLLIGRIRGSRRPLPARTEAQIQPTILTTLGRSGSKWLVWLLGCHPQIIAFNPLIYEPRVATYWMSVFRALSAPKSFLRQIHTEKWEMHWWLGAGEVELPAPLDADLASWLGRDAVESLAAMCQTRIESFYAEVGASAGKPAPSFFVEKFLLDPVPVELMSEIYPGAKEVILVRDFRDRLSSVLAWNERQGHPGFGRELVTSDAEFITSRLRIEAQSLLQHWRNRADEAHLVRYEDLVLEPRRTLADILAHLGLPHDESTVDLTLDRAREAGSGLDAHRTAADALSSIGRWGHDLDPSLIALCEREFAEVLEEFGYARKAPVRAGGG